MALTEVFQGIARAGAALALTGTVVFADSRPTHIPPPESFQARTEAIPSQEQAVAKLARAIRNKDAAAILELTDLRNFSWGVAYSDLQLGKFNETTLKKTLSEAFEAGTQITCLNYRETTTKEHELVPVDGIKVLVSGFQSKNLLNHKSTGNVAIQFKKDANGYKLVSIQEYTLTPGLEKGGLIEDWSKWTYCAQAEEAEPRRIVIYHGGATTQLDNSGSAAGSIKTFVPLKEKMHEGHDRANAINASRSGTVDSKGNYTASRVDCEDTLRHPFEVGSNLVRIIEEFIRARPQDYIIVVGHSAAGPAEMQAIQTIRANTLRDPNYPVRPDRVTFITAHSPILGVDNHYSIEARKFGVWSCDFLGMPNTNSPLIQYLRDLWDDRDNTKQRIESNVRWYRGAGGRVISLKNIYDKLYLRERALFWKIPGLEFIGGIPELVSTQDVPGAENYTFWIESDFLNHTSILDTDQGMKFIVKLAGSKFKG